MRFFALLGMTSKVILPITPINQPFLVLLRRRMTFLNSIKITNLSPQGVSKELKNYGN